jgi:hypothetical protein
VSDLGAAAPVARPAKAVPIGAFSNPWAANLKFCIVLDKQDRAAEGIDKCILAKDRTAVLYLYKTLARGRKSDEIRQDHIDVAEAWGGEPEMESPGSSQPGEFTAASCTIGRWLWQRALPDGALDGNGHHPPAMEAAHIRGMCA